MPVAGDIINKANFTNAWAATYNDSTKSNSTTPEWYYVSALSFVVQCYVDYNLFATPKQIVTCHCYDYDTGIWTQVFHKNCLSYSNGQKLKFYHNRDAESGGASFVYRDNDASRKCHLFRFRLERNSGNTNTKSGIDVWCGGAGVLTDSEYENYCKGRPIISNGKLGTSNGNFVWYGGRESSSPDSTAISAFNPANNKGSKILAGYEYNCVPKW